MPKIKNTPTAKAKVSVLYVIPTFVATTECPHCNHLNLEEVPQGVENKSLLHPCAACGEDYFMLIPNSFTK